MSRVALLSDIHGNLPALNAVLKHMDSIGVDQIIVTGDFITDCPNPNEVIEVLRSREASFIRGNRENYLLNELDGGNSFWPGKRQFESLQWTLDHIKPENLNWIRSLPGDMVVKTPGCPDLHIVHGSTESDRELLLSSKKERVEEVLSGITEDYLVCGHTHLPWSCKIGKKVIINPGAVGVSFNEEPLAEYVILTSDKDSWSVEHYGVPYSVDELKECYRNHGLLGDRDVWSNLIIDSLESGENRNVTFIESCQSNGSYITNDEWDKTWEQYKSNA